MKFSVGDKVSFLNEKLSGTISSIVSDKLYKVDLEDGFPIDAAEKELVLISKAITEEIKQPEPEKKNSIEEKPAKHTDIFSLLENDGLYFVSMPAEELQVLSGPVNFYLINKTSFKILFSFSANIHKQTTGISSGTLNAQSELLLLRKKRADLIDWSNFIIQIILFNEGAFDLAAPFTRELPVLLPDLKMEFNQVKGASAYSKYVQLFSAKDRDLNFEGLKNKFSKETEPVEKRTSTPSTSKTNSNKENDHLFGIIRNETEVDLHIQHLIDDYKNLSNAEILHIQLKKFRSEMDNALRNHYHKIIFIHGVGNGVLRAELIRELRNYDGVRHFEASYEKYGYGATEVVLT